MKFVLLFALLASFPAFAQKSPKLELSLQQGWVNQQRQDLLIWLKDSPQFTAMNSDLERKQRIDFVVQSLKNTAIQSQAPIIAALKKMGLEHQAFYIDNVIYVQNATAAQAKQLANFSSVRRLSLNHQTRLKLPEVKVSRFVDFEIGSNIEAVKAPKVWNELKTRGENIVIAGADTGFDYRHPALRKKYRGTQVFSINHDYNWRDAITKGGNRQCPAKSPEPCDDGDHGTHTMGTMVGDDEGENQIGVAPGATWIGCRNMNVGAGTVSTYLDCMEFFIAPYPVGGDSRRDGKPEMAPHIINNSWGCPTSEGCKGDEFVNSIRALKAAGIIFVAAAGNEGPGCGSVGDPPGTYYGDIVSVGALDHRNNTIASFSSRGPSAFNGAVGIDLVAPGNSVRSTVPGGKYESKAGTSMASPHVAGAIALLWSYRPELLGKVDQTLEQLRKTAIPMTSNLTCGQYPGANRPNTTFGYGALDTYQLLTQ